MLNAVLQLRFDVPVGLTAHRHDGACAGPEDAGKDGNVIADHVVEHQSCLCLIHQGCDMTDIYGLPDVGKLVFLPESFEQIAEGFFRVLLRAHTIHRDATRLLHYSLSCIDILFSLRPIPRSARTFLVSGRCSRTKRCLGGHTPERAACTSRWSTNA